MKESIFYFVLGVGFFGIVKLLFFFEVIELFLGFFIFERVVLVVLLVSCFEFISLLVFFDFWVEDIEVFFCFFCLVRVFCLIGLVCFKFSFFKIFLVFVFVFLGGIISVLSFSDFDLIGGFGGFFCFVRLLVRGGCFFFRFYYLFVL